MSYSTFGYTTAQRTSYWRMYTGTNCTNYVAYRLVTTNGMPNVRPASGVGNAEDWGTAMSSVTDSTPTVGSVAWWGRTGHHVAYVEKVVSSTEILVSESNWSGAFDWRRITRTSSGWPDGFIHFADRTLDNSVAPYVAGDVKVGSAVKAGAGRWSPTGNTFTYQWLANGVAISGADDKTLTLPSPLLGKKLSFVVTASRPTYPTVRLTSPAIAVAAGTLSPTTAPTVSGAPRVGTPVGATPGGWTPRATSYAYRWSVGGVRVAGATSATYTPVASDGGKALTVTSTAILSGYTSRSATSAASASVAMGSIKPGTPPSVGGVPAVGVRLTANPGTYSPARPKVAYQWLRGTTVIPGAVSATYVPTAADLRATIGVRVTASRLGYMSYSATSPQTAVVRPGTLVSTAPPTISGAARVGSRLTATAGRWSNVADLTYQWYASGRAIPRATSPTYTPTSDILGDRVRVRVTARQSGFTAAAASSVNTPSVTAGSITFSAAPKISGNLSQGSILRLVRGATTPSTATVRYQWLRDGKVITGATGSSRRVKSGDGGRRLSVRVTATAPGHTKLVVLTRARRASR